MKPTLLTRDTTQCVDILVLNQDYLFLRIKHGEVYSIQHYVIKVCQRLETGRFSPVTLISSNNKTDHHDITEICGRHGRDRIVVRFTTTYAISAHHN
jgi:uncharacterized protein (DUF924 family)